MHAASDLLPEMSEERNPEFLDDPYAFVAHAQQATNSGDTAWPMTVYSSDVELELVGDGIRDIHQGATAVQSALENLYQWLREIDADVRKEFFASSDRTIVNSFEARLFGGKQVAYGVELWRFDHKNEVIRNVLYGSINRLRRRAQQDS